MTQSGMLSMTPTPPAWASISLQFQQQPHFCIFWKHTTLCKFWIHCQVQYHILQFHKTTQVSKVKSKFWKQTTLSSTIPHTTDCGNRLHYANSGGSAPGLAEDLFLPWHQLLCNCLLHCFSLYLAGSTCVFSHQTVHWLRTCFFLHQKIKLSDIWEKGGELMKQNIGHMNE